MDVSITSGVGVDITVSCDSNVDVGDDSELEEEGSTAKLSTAVDWQLEVSQVVAIATLPLVNAKIALCREKPCWESVVRNLFLT